MRENRTLEVPEMTQEVATAPEVTDSGNLDKALTSDPILSAESELDRWEVQNGKYGLEYLGIKELATEFPMKAQFGMLDKYIKGELEARGYDKTPTAWQDILKELEDSIGSSKLNAYERMNKLASYIKILQKYQAIKAKKEAYMV